MYADENANKYFSCIFLAGPSFLVKFTGRRQGRLTNNKQVGLGETSPPPSSMGIIPTLFRFFSERIPFKETFGLALVVFILVCDAPPILGVKIVVVMVLPILVPGWVSQ